MKGTLPAVEDGLANSVEGRPFLAVARAKGLGLEFGCEESAAAPVLWRVDLDLVRLSIANALARAARLGLDQLVPRLEWLQREGTPEQQIDFVLGTGAVYYFPPDIAKMVQSGPQAAHPFTKQPFTWVRCRPRADGTHCGEERSRTLCLIHKSVKSQSENPP